MKASPIGRADPAILIEDPTPLRLLTLLLTYRRYRKICYTRERPLTNVVFRTISSLASRSGIPLTKLEYAHYNGSYFEVQEELYFNANDILWERYQRNIYAKVMETLCPEDCFRYALKKELLNRYTTNRVKTLIFLTHLLEEYEHVVFLPRDNEDVVSLLRPESRPPARYSIPRTVRLLNRLKRAVGPLLLLALPLFLAGLIVKSAARGIAFRAEQQHFRIGIDIQSVGLKRDRGLIDGQFFLYDQEAFSPPRILHVVRDQLEDAPAIESLRMRNAPFVEASRIKIPAACLVRAAGTLFARLPRAVMTCLRSCNARTCFLLPSLSVMKMTMEAESFYEQYDVDLFIARDEYSPYHIVRTCIARRHGNRTASFQWYDDNDRGELTSHFVFDRYALWGEFYQEFLGKTLGPTRTAIIGGCIYGADSMFRQMQTGTIPDPYRELKEQYTLIAIMGSTFSPVHFLTRETTLTFYRDALALLSRYPKVYCILKPKDASLDAELSELVKQYPRARIEREMHTYRFLPVIDAVVTICNSSIGIEALMIGKKAFYYEMTGFSKHPYAAYSPHLVAFTRGDLERNLDRCFNDGLYIDEGTLDMIRAHHTFQFDGRVVERFKSMCFEILNEMGA